VRIREIPGSQESADSLVPGSSREHGSDASRGAPGARFRRFPGIPGRAVSTSPGGALEPRSGALEPPNSFIDVLARKCNEGFTAGNHRTDYGEIGHFAKKTYYSGFLRKPWFSWFRPVRPDPAFWRFQGRSGGRFGALPDLVRSSVWRAAGSGPDPDSLVPGILPGRNFSRNRWFRRSTVFVKSEVPPDLESCLVWRLVPGRQTSNSSPPEPQDLGPGTGSPGRLGRAGRAVGPVPQGSPTSPGTRESSPPRIPGSSPGTAGFPPPSQTGQTCRKCVFRKKPL
jgi:hypothetical protein